MSLDRDVVFTHEVALEWEARLVPVLSETLRKHRRGRVGRSWDTDETSLKEKGRWTYLYRVIDRDGNMQPATHTEEGDIAFGCQLWYRSLERSQMVEIRRDRIQANAPDSDHKQATEEQMFA